MKRPKINIWMIIFLGLSLLVSAFVAVWCFRDAFFPPPKVLEQYSEMPVRAKIWNFNLLILSALLSTTCIVVLPMVIMKKRSAWVWYVVMGFLAFSVILSFWRGIPSLLNLAPTIILMWFWYSKENRRWYRVIYSKN